MSLDVKIVGKDGEAVKITENAMEVIVHDHPAKGDHAFLLPFREFMSNSAGATDMLVDGSTTPQVFSINARQDYDIWVRSVSFTISDAGATLSKFGNLTALTTGCALAWESNALGHVTIGDGLKSNFDFVQMADFNPSFGDGTAAFRAGNAVGTSEAFVPTLDFSKSFGFKWGIPLIKGTQDRIIFTINDNVSTIDRFDAVVKGVKL
jgi:hypothetical protein